MGVSGLIPFLERASTIVNINQLSGCTVAVDSYCWLHRGVYTCAEKLIRGVDTDIYVHYCLKYLKMLQDHHITVVMVFDGRHLPAKAETERRRRESRKDAERKAKEHLRNNEIEKARSYMRRAVDVNHVMALKLIKVCRERHNVECLVAPYEADAQMAWLAKVGLVDYIITEDSDLTLFGAPRILFKLDLNGQALLVEANKLSLTMGCNTVRKYNFEKFRRMCILSGCDYLDSLPGIGLKKACKFILLTEEEDMCKALKKLPQYLNMRSLQVTDEYIEMFLKAEATFRHMYIFNTMKRRMERLHKLEEFETAEKYCSNAGELMNVEQSFQLALGNLDPFSLNKVDNWNPDRKLVVTLVKDKYLKIGQYCKNGNNFNIKKRKSKPSKIWQLMEDDQDVFPTKTNKRDLFELNALRSMEYKNPTEIDSDFYRKEERGKLSEMDIFSMYKVATREKLIAVNVTNSEEKHAKILQVGESPEKSRRKSIHNPFAMERHQYQKKNNSLSSPLIPMNKCPVDDSSEKNSPVEIRTEKAVEIRSRFFADNICGHKSTNNELTQTMTQVRDITKGRKLQQQNIYLLNSPPSPYSVKPNRYEMDLSSKVFNGDKNKSLTNCISEKNNDYSTTEIGLKAPTLSGGKLKENSNHKQMTLTMFGFCTRPMPKKPISSEI